MVESISECVSWCEHRVDGGHDVSGWLDMRHSSSTTYTQHVRHCECVIVCRRIRLLLLHHLMQMCTAWVAEDVRVAAVLRRRGLQPSRTCTAWEAEDSYYMPARSRHQQAVEEAHRRGKWMALGRAQGADSREMAGRATDDMGTAQWDRADTMWSCCL